MAWKKTYTPEERAEYQRKQAQEMQDIFQRIDKFISVAQISLKRIHLIKKFFTIEAKAFDSVPFAQERNS